MHKVADLSVTEIKAIAKAVGIRIEEPHLSEVTHCVNALRDVLDSVDMPGLNQIEPLPIIYSDPVD